ncbi:MAG: hypothetical protein JWQ89_2235 [Devosia sp.]|uniref:hypothetical protein n=1 Tax=Devosia sp. TaxID=1871048 RepID=UPI00263336F6|nr:hypothetical protein [Devosia sp.]MDB5540508.1 hypothetical protein [Devosia sp.]
MEWLTSLGIPQEYTGFATVAFVILAAGFAAYSRTIGKKEGPDRPKVQEFYAAGQLADMGPVKELVEGVGLLIQQQVRTNMHLEATADAIKGLAKLYEEHLEAQATQEEVEDRAQQLFERRLAEERPLRRRIPTRKKPSTG